MFRAALKSSPKSFQLHPDTKRIRLVISEFLEAFLCRLVEPSKFGYSESEKL